MPGCIGNIDCTHWQWLKCPKALAGQGQCIHYGMLSTRLILNIIVELGQSYPSSIQAVVYTCCCSEYPFQRLMVTPD